ncbi:GNAT superfamily N-acetyltransferase [Janthinobacterium sp. CG_23.3]|uniref:GNAT family N-acetyltransferase n=1 Tax=Janthinobacterium sp. CG_23.3 TaxID=3349634 RepID=UPI0038D515EC
MSTHPSPVNIARAAISRLPDAQLLLSEYYAAVGVTKRDTQQEIEAFLNDASSALWIAYVGDIPAGCVVLRPLASIALAAECKRLYVRPQFRGRGLAESLLDAMEEHAVAAAVQWLYLDSKDDLTGALRIYAGRGYQACERYNDNPQATVFLRKDLRV